MCCMAPTMMRDHTGIWSRAVCLCPGSRLTASFFVGSWQYRSFVRLCIPRRFLGPGIRSFVRRVLHVRFSFDLVRSRVFNRLYVSPWRWGALVYVRSSDSYLDDSVSTIGKLISIALEHFPNSDCSFPFGNPN